MHNEILLDFCLAASFLPPITINMTYVILYHKMPHLRLSLDDEADQKLRLFMAANNVSSKEAAINQILKELTF